MVYRYDFRDYRSIVGRWLLLILLGADLTTGFNLTTLVVSVIGAVIVVALYRMVAARR